MLRPFSRKAKRRISNSVHFTERWARRNATPALLQSGPAPVSRLGITSGAVNDGNSASVDIAKGPPGSEAAFGGGNTITAWNITGSTIAASTLVELIPTALARSTSPAFEPRLVWYMMPFKAGTTPTPPDEQIFRFETTAAKTQGSNVAAERVIWNGSAYVKDGTAVVAVDTFGVWGPSNSGASGMGSLKPDRTDISGDPAYDILWIEAKARYIRYTLTADITSGSATATVNSYWGESLNGQDPGATVTVYDKTASYAIGENGDQGYAVLNEQTDEYWIIEHRMPVCRDLHNLLAIPNDSSDYALVMDNTGGTRSCNRELIEECPP